MNDNKNINGTDISQQIKNDVKLDVEKLISQGITPKLTVVIVGENPASLTYVASKERQAKEIGMNSNVIRLPEESSQKELLGIIEELNNDSTVHGILVQLPVPKQINEEVVINAISPDKDVDGLHPVNLGKLVLGEARLVSCTPAGVIEMLDREKIAIEGKNVVIIGRSNIVGKPLFHLFLKRNATVTVCHSKTKDLIGISKTADILVAAIGRTKMITKEYIKLGAVVIDVGINRVDGKLYGDVDYEDVLPFVSRITPVPRGVGPMTIAMLLKNTITAAKTQHNIK
ncbi:MAG: bifunctional methylenetetrahydrofolate dehydrogenase/methenyltetrahydrofolate cyclohydrolase [Candidatus Margulisbacteria bacterium GWF2_35_9]|nr:MAG: bifunctional methylenetetrahydrofolate dehydrogenase/methenyltetrahydrofolate cyclohydrolase [Candidatus Margulisbacteria bacterium GWF2_35_9]